jgi:hypothetical protein
MALEPALPLDRLEERELLRDRSLKRFVEPRNAPRLDMPVELLVEEEEPMAAAELLEELLELSEPDEPPPPDRLPLNPAVALL